MARPTGDGLVVVRSPFFAGKRLVSLGEVWAADDRVVRSYPNAFRPLEVRSSDPAPKATPRRPRTVRVAAGRRPTRTTAAK